MDVISLLEQKEITPDLLAIEIENNFSYFNQILLGFNHQKAHVKYPCGKVMIMLSESNPNKVYPYFEQISNLLNQDNTILKWNAMFAIANISGEDTKGYISEEFIKKFIEFIWDKSMITAANAINSLGKIAAKKPEFAEIIADNILKTEHFERETDECKRIICGHAITSFEEFSFQLKNKQPIVEFAQRQLQSERSGTAKKAGLFLKKINQTK